MWKCVPIVVILCLCAEFNFEDPDISEKRRQIEKCLADPDAVNLEEWQNLAKSKGGLISGNSLIL